MRTLVLLDNWFCLCLYCKMVIVVLELLHSQLKILIDRQLCTLEWSAHLRVSPEVNLAVWIGHNRAGHVTLSIWQISLRVNSKSYLEAEYIIEAESLNRARPK